MMRRPQPRSILGFISLMTGLIATAIVAVCIALIGSDMEWLIAVLMGILILIAIAFMIAVFNRAKDDPGGLLLTDVTPRDYAALMMISQGDDRSGERAERMLAPPIIDSTAVEQRVSELPPGDETPEETSNGE